MSVDTHANTTENDPLTAALADAGVHERLTAAARAFLGCRARSLSATQRAAEAEEIVQDAKTAAWKRRADYDPTRDAANWLMGFVRNVARDYLKKRARTPTGPPPDAPGLEDLAVDLSRPASDVAADQEVVEVIITQLKPDEQELVQLVYFDGLTFEEIAAQRGTRVGTERVRCTRMLQRLRHKFGVGGEVQS